MSHSTGTRWRRTAAALSGRGTMLLAGVAVSCLCVAIIFRSDPAPVSELSWEDTLFGDLSERPAAARLPAPAPPRSDPPHGVPRRFPSGEVAATPAAAAMDDDPPRRDVLLMPASVEDDQQAASPVQSLGHHTDAAAWLGVEIEQFEQIDPSGGNDTPTSERFSADPPAAPPVSLGQPTP